MTDEVSDDVTEVFVKLRIDDIQARPCRRHSVPAVNSTILLLLLLLHILLILLIITILLLLLLISQLIVLLLPLLLLSKQRYCDTKCHAMCVCVCMSALPSRYLASTACHIRLGGEGNVLCPVLSCCYCHY